MPVAALPDKPTGLALVFHWRRVRFALLAGGLFGLMVGSGWKSGFYSGFGRVMALAFVGMMVFGLFEHWPRRLPGFLARWVLQVAGVAAAMPLATWAIYVISTPDGGAPFWTEMERVKGFAALSGLGLFFAPWFALAALVRQKDALARHHALAFDLARSELRRQTLDARLTLLQAQVAPHFLFNTLANVKALVDSGSPRASAVLDSLIAYLRAAVPRLHEPASSLGQELQLARAYLELMHMRMPDRLQFALDVDESALSLRCAPMTVLTLVENAVRHGIDPSEEGGRIDIVVQRRGGRCLVRVSDTGLGVAATSQGLGTGLSSLRERLELMFGGDAQLRLSEQQPQGMVAEVDFPAREATA